jgi:hypothetical protein
MAYLGIWRHLKATSYSGVGQVRLPRKHVEAMMRPLSSSFRDAVSKDVLQSLEILASEFERPLESMLREAILDLQKKYER